MNDTILVMDEGEFEDLRRQKQADERQAYIQGAKDALSLLIEVAMEVEGTYVGVNSLREFYRRIDRGEWPKEKPDAG